MTPQPADESCAPTRFRGVYLWAGQATIDLHHEKFPDMRVDEAAHHAAHGDEGATLLTAMGCNWAFLSMNWGFPAEQEQAHWTDFERAAHTYHAAGLKVLGYVQASNCVARGGHAKRDWYARTPVGRRSSYYCRRLMTCWNHPDWVAEVQGHAERAIDLGADGVFFDNLWMGVTPWALGGVVGGFAGCACERCAAAYHQAEGRPIPRALRDDDNSRAYLRWRAGVVTARLGGWAAAVRRRRPEALVVANNCDAILRDTAALFGQRLADVSRPQSALLVENVAMPRFDANARRLIANAVVIKAVQAQAPDRLVLALPYEHGIGLDGPPSAIRARRLIAEALACGAAPIVKGTEFRDARARMTVLTADEFAAYRDAVGVALQWANRAESLFAGAKREAEIGIFWDRAAVDERWGAVVPETIAIALALIAEARPFRFVSADELPCEDLALRLLLVPSGANPPAWSMPEARLHRLAPGQIDVPGRPSPLWSQRIAHRAIELPMQLLARGYFSSSHVRRAIDASGLASRFLVSPLFRLPRRLGALRALLPPAVTPVECQAPVLVERYRRAEGGRLLHLVNYSDEPQSVSVRLPGSAQPRLHTPDAETRLVASEDCLRLQLGVHAVLEW